jgi:hypothetical protein
MECARSMILAQGLELEFWGEAVNTAMYIKNRCPTKALNSIDNGVVDIGNNVVDKSCKQSKT